MTIQQDPWAYYRVLWPTAKVPQEWELTPDEIIIRITQAGFGITQLICGLAVTKRGNEATIVCKAIGEFVNEETKYRCLYFQFQSYLRTNVNQ